MKYFKKTILIFIFTYSNISFATMMLPFKDWEKNNQNWGKDDSEIAYVFSRCGVLQSLVGGYFVSSSTKDVKLKGETLIAKGYEFVKLGMEISKGTGMFQDAINQRHKFIRESYVSDMEKNKLVNNNIFIGNIGADFTFCTSLENATNPTKSN